MSLVWNVGWWLWSVNPVTMSKTLASLSVVSSILSISTFAVQSVMAYAWNSDGDEEMKEYAQPRLSLPKLISLREWIISKTVSVQNSLGNRLKSQSDFQQQTAPQFSKTVSVQQTAPQFSLHQPSSSSVQETVQYTSSFPKQNQMSPWVQHLHEACLALLDECIDMEHYKQARDKQYSQQSWLWLTMGKPDHVQYNIRCTRMQHQLRIAMDQFVQAYQLELLSQSVSPLYEFCHRKETEN